MNEDLKFRINDWGQEETVYDLESNTSGKINLGPQATFSSHRSGWNYAINALKPEHNHNGVAFYGFLEDYFSWRTINHINNNVLPFRHKWVGFFHNPHNGAPWFGRKENMPQNMVSSTVFKESLKNCLGLWTLSEYSASFFKKNTGVPVSALIHPTEIPKRLFDFNSFLINPKKRLINIGHWQRKINSIDSFPLKGSGAHFTFLYTKTRLFPFPQGSQPHRHVKRLKVIERELESVAPSCGEVEELHQVPNQKYDELLSQNIVFLDLYDSSANNTIIECIARATPILVNPLPAVIEYLGSDYPFYFSCTDEALMKLSNLGIILKAHNYLKNLDTRRKLRAEVFLREFRDSETYDNIP